jgi:hypothetical protein
MGGDDSPSGTELTQVAQRRYDPDEELSTTVVFALADARGVAPAEVNSPPLYERVDAAALERTFFGPQSGPVSGSVEFRYEEFLVRVGSDGWVRVFEAE